MQGSNQFDNFRGGMHQNMGNTNNEYKYFNPAIMVTE